MRILVITNCIPYPPMSGGTLRAYNLLKRIARHHDVWLATNLHHPDEVSGVTHLETFCAGVITGVLERHHPLMYIPSLLRYAVAGWPLEHRFNHSAELAHKIEQLVSEIDFDIVQIEESSIALYLEQIPKDAPCKRVWTFYDIHFVREERIVQVDRSPTIKARRWLYRHMMRRWEPRYAERFDRCVVVSEIDRELLLGVNPRLNVCVVPNGVDTKDYRPLPQEATSPALMFIGSMRYSPCNDAVLYFADEVLPLIRRIMPEVEMWIVGPNPSAQVRRLDGEGTHVTGRVDDVRPYYARCSVCVVPLRAGGGTRLKILEAMALGRPVVTTTMGCEGLGVVDGEHLLVADTPAKFAEQVLRLLTDRTLYERLVTNGRALVVAQYEWDAIAETHLHMYAEMMASVDTAMRL
jgi:sugar transferase (PEP-CTERM/EpsH1 system associated)